MCFRYAVVVASVVVLKVSTNTGERGTGNGERGTGVWERVYSGNLPDNLIQNGGRRKQREQVRKCHGCKGEFLLAVYQDDSTFLLA